MGERRRRPVRASPGRVLALLAVGALTPCVVAVLAFGGYVVRDAYRAGHQSDPTEAVEEFLDATLNERNLDLADNDLCDGRRLADRVQRMITAINGLENRFHVSVEYDWAYPHGPVRHGSVATVAVEVGTLTTHSDGLMQTGPRQRWTFDLRNRSGWKICGFTVPGGW